eukprot:TRINITY_DN6101_c0_g1_i1.p1 TRINITY_DN6101_c0_g1~~TRINITY_DN6101_c0_g1_i1.p1  ORF type:complete len:226 (+),score=40.96 TRINITY_DN6101_c0_g1_i1:73-750(+)
MNLVSPTDVVDLVTKYTEEHREDVVIEGTPEDELNNLLEQTPPVPNPEAAANKLITCINVLYDSLLPCLVATPLVYMSDSEWKLHSHSDFRATKRKELKEMEGILSNNLFTQPVAEVLPKLLDDFDRIFSEVLDVRVPAMPSMYLTENYYDLKPMPEIAAELKEKLAIGKKYGEVSSRVKQLVRVLLQWFLYCPVGRPQVYASDSEWTLVNERVLRKEFRGRLLK